MSSPPPEEQPVGSLAPRRAVAVALVAVALSGAGVVNAVVHDPGGSPPPPTPAASPAITFGARVSSQGWHCAGPLPIGRGTDSALQLVNLNALAITGEVTLSGPAGVISTSPVRLGGRSSLRFPLPDRGPRRQAAATVLFAGSGAGVEEIVGDTRGRGVLGGVPMGSPCVDRESSTLYLAAGDSRGADNVDLALYDPGSTPAVADVSFATTSGSVAPPAFQGVAVGAGSVVVLDVGRAVPGQAMLATRVSVSGGELVGGALLTVARGRGVETSLVSTSLSTAPSWSFAALPAGPGTTQALAVFDPGTRPADVLLKMGGSAGTLSASASVPAGGAVLLAPASESGVGALRFDQLILQGGSPVVAAEELVNGPLAAPATSTVRTVVRSVAVKVRGKTVTRHSLVRVVVPGPPPSPTKLPSLPAGYAAAAGVAAPARSWVLPLGEADRTNGEVVELANPGSRPAHVTLEPIAPSGLGRAVISGLGGIVVPPHGALGVSLAGLVHPAGPLSLFVSSDRQILVGSSIYPRKLEVGLTGGPGIPIAP